MEKTRPWPRLWFKPAPNPTLWVCMMTMQIETLFPWLLNIAGEPLTILAAVRRNDVAALRRMLADGADPDKPLSEDFSTPLTVALKLGHTRCAELLVLAGACLYARDLWKNSPLRFMMYSHEFAG